jgi:hypothetical protein
MAPVAPFPISFARHHDGKILPHPGCLVNIQKFIQNAVYLATAGWLSLITITWAGNVK